ncbi:hypothetical protein Dda_7216 [Drechslerella dactyloides]|uniref:Endo-1,5-alpha-L-arabinanase A n=1 Tax=Drechslerella dactyloides TaxID=74499 RepID=A0AAD6IS61_DREDA|nr:hypothetical protein Dda_7216 [Drechslerella dactyloides]
MASFGSQVSTIGVATSTTMDPGTWVDQGSTEVSSKAGSAYNAIDSNIVKVGSDFYMNFGSFWGDIYQVKMESNLRKKSGSSYQIAWTSFGNGAMEGAFMYYRSGYYYLFTSWGNCCQLVPRPASVVLESHGYVYAPGHGGVIEVPNVGSVLYYHYGKTITPSVTTFALSLIANANANESWIFLTNVLLFSVNNNQGTNQAATYFGWNVIGWSGGWPTV